MKKKMIYLLRWLLFKRYDEEAWGWWLWENTPYPVGRPSWSQIWWGYKWALLPLGWAGESPCNKYDRQEAERQRVSDRQGGEAGPTEGRAEAKRTPKERDGGNPPGRPNGTQL